MTPGPGLDVAVRVRRRDFLLEIDLEVDAGRRLALVGPSGAGKTSVLKTVAGLIKPESGRVEIAGRSVFDFAVGIDLPPEARRCGYVPQDYSLFPHLNASANVAFGMRGGRPADRRRRANELLERLGIGQLAGVRPDGLSGGEQQRVALARALATEPDLFLFDEPLAALDATTREGAIPVMNEVLDAAGVPTLIVTHSRSQAERLADATVVIDRGRISETHDHKQPNRSATSSTPAKQARGPVSIHRVVRR